MRCANGSLAIVALFAFAGSLLAQSPEEDQRQAFFKGLREGAAARGEGIEIVPVPRFGAEGEAAPAGGGDGVGVVQIDEAEVAPQGAIQFEAAIIHLASSEGFAPEELAVSGETVDELLEQWTANGKVKRITTCRLSAIDQAEGFMTFGEQAPFATARSAFGGRGGPTQTAITYQDVGTRLSVRGRIDGAEIVAECSVEESRLEPAIPSSTPAPDGDAADASMVRQDPANVPTVRKLNAETVVAIPDGGKVILSASFQKTEEGSSATIVTLKASILP